MAPLAASGFAELSTAIMACLPAVAGSKPGGFTPGFQPRIVPSSAANRKKAGPDVGVPLPSTPVITNAFCARAMLKTRPVGAPDAPCGLPGAGIATTSDSGCPAVLYSVDTLAPLSATQNGDVGDSPTPHGFTRFGSKNFAT